MSRKKNRKADKYAKQKLAAVPALLCLLAYVLWSNTASDSPGPVSVGQSTVSVPPSPKESERPQVSWPQPNLDFLDGPNPLANFRQQELRQREQGEEEPVHKKLVKIDPGEKQQHVLEEAAAEVTRQPLRFSFHTPRKKVVMLGNRLLNVGDSITDGVRVRSITKGNLVLEWDSTQDGRLD